MREPAFHNKDGSLTRYALNCGYVEVKGAFSLWREGGCFHLRGRDQFGKQVWENPPTLKEARRRLGQLYRANRRELPAIISETLTEYNLVVNRLDRVNGSGEHATEIEKLTKQKVALESVLGAYGYMLDWSPKSRLYSVYLDTTH